MNTTGDTAPKAHRLRDAAGRALAARRRGTATIWGVLSIGLFLTTAALVVDGALLYASQADLQAAADAAALAGASGLIDGPNTARQRATEYGEKNTAGGTAISVNQDDVVLGDWDPDTRTFTPLAPGDEVSADAVRVTAGLDEEHGNPVRMAFAQIFGSGEVDVRASATAVYRPRDIVLVIDLSGSMNYDSQIRNIPYLGEQAIRDNLYQIWQELGGHTYGTMQFDPVYISSNDDWYVRNRLGLAYLPYPYPSGSWNDYINYVQGDSTLSSNSYRKQYGMMTFVNYLLERRRGANQTPDLWMTSHQPLTAVKEAVDIFLDYLRDVATEDRVALAVFTASNGTALLEHGLTEDIETIRSLVWHRQAGHYHGSTNIGAGMQVGRQELETNGRTGTLKTIVLLTDGQANLPAEYATQYVIDESYAAADAGFPIAAISLGAGADHALMQQVAETTEGVYFSIPGGQSVADYEEDLRDVFRHIATVRPLRLVD